MFDVQSVDCSLTREKTDIKFKDRYWKSQFEPRDPAFWHERNVSPKTAAENLPENNR